MMCGICGIVSFNKPIDPVLLLEMRDKMTHRGPDSAGCVFFKKKSENSRFNNNEALQFNDLNAYKAHEHKNIAYSIGLAHRRLSIIDLSSSGHQPMPNENADLWLTFNGEIYNYLDLREELLAKGHRFKSNSDAEVILHAYEEWGQDCVNFLNGMFSFVLFDNRGNKQQLFLSRDRVGEKPLYYCEYEDGFAFASELKALLTIGPSGFDIDYDALNFYLTYGYIPENKCIKKGIKKLPPAHSALYDIDKRVLTVSSYWSLPEHAPENQTNNIDHLVDELEELLIDSIKLRMISDVPLGVFLSGGVDSSLVTAIAARSSTNPIKTFTISFPNAKNYDEAGYAKIVSDFFDTEHSVLKCDQNIINTFDELSPLVDEPIADSSILPTYIISKLTRKHVKVVLGGDGGDELFGGYNHYKHALCDKKKLAFIPNELLFFLAQAANKLPAGIKGRGKLVSLQGGYLEERVWGTPFFDMELRKRILSKHVLEKIGNNLNAPEQWKQKLLSKGKNDIDKLTQADFYSYLPEDILTKVDRSSMACSLELRSPWLDHRIIELSYKKIPPQYKVYNGVTRILQKKLAERILPKKLNIERKQGFSIPLDQWFFNDKSEKFKKYLSNVNGLISDNELNALISGQMNGRSNNSRLFALMMLTAMDKK